MDEFCRRMPKVELHAHLAGSVSRATVTKLVELKSKRTGQQHVLTQEQTAVIADGRSVDIKRVFELFPIIQAVTDSDEAVYMATVDVIGEFASDNVHYLELRSTPRACHTTGMTIQSYITNVLKAIKHAQNDLITVRYICSIDRRQSVQQAEQSLQVVLALNHGAEYGGLIVGMDLSGSPDHDGIRFIPVLNQARQAGLKCSLHLAETADVLDELVELVEVADRIGHGTYLNNHKQADNVVVAKRIPLEICQTSNVKTETVASFEDGHVGVWLHRVVPICISVLYFD